MASSINTDILKVILSRLPVKSFLRFKCVSKEWNSIISDPNFKLAAQQQDGQVLTVIVWDYEGDDHRGLLKYYPITDEQALLHVGRLDDCQTPIICREEDVMVMPRVDPITRVLGSCDGLVLFGLNEDIYFWNPSTRRCVKVLEIPELGDTHYSVVTSGIVYDSSVNDYKVAVVLEDIGGGDGNLIDFALLKEKNWQHVRGCHPVLDNDVHDDDDDDDGVHGGVFIYGADDVDGESVFLGGPVVNDRIHWLIKGDPRQIVYFDFNSDQKGSFPIPPADNGVDNVQRYAGLGLSDGLLCLFRPRGGEGIHQVLVMRVYGDEGSWIPKCNLNLASLDGDITSAVFFTTRDG